MEQVTLSQHTRLFAKKISEFAGSMIYLAIFLCLWGTSSRANAHPHVFVETSARIVFDDQRRVVAIQSAWTFDESYSAFVTLGLTADGNVATVQQLRPIAETNIEQLAAFEWFTVAKDEVSRAEFKAPTDYSLIQRDDRRLVLSFVLPLKTPMSVSNTLVIQVFDPTYYVAFDLAITDPVTMTNGPAGCSVAVLPANSLDASEREMVLAAKKRDTALSSIFAARLSGQVRISCG